MPLKARPPVSSATDSEPSASWEKFRTIVRRSSSWMGRPNSASFAEDPRPACPARRRSRGRRSRPGPPARDPGIPAGSSRRGSPRRRRAPSSSPSRGERARHALDHVQGGDGELGRPVVLLRGLGADKGDPGIDVEVAADRRVLGRRFRDEPVLVRGVGHDAHAPGDRAGSGSASPPSRRGGRRPGRGPSGASGRRGSPRGRPCRRAAARSTTERPRSGRSSSRRPRRSCR